MLWSSPWFWNIREPSFEALLGTLFRCEDAWSELRFCPSSDFHFPLFPWTQFLSVRCQSIVNSRSAAARELAGLQHGPDLCPVSSGDQSGGSMVQPRHVAWLQIPDLVSTIKLFPTHILTLCKKIKMRVSICFNFQLTKLSIQNIFPKLRRTHFLV